MDSSDCSNGLDAHVGLSRGALRNQPTRTYAENEGSRMSAGRNLNPCGLGLKAEYVEVIGT